MALIRVRARQPGIKGYINCMRGSWLGNPFPLSKYDKNLCIILYRKYLKWRIKEDAIFHKYLNDLHIESLSKDIFLGCTCRKDRVCHVDVLIQEIRKLR